MRKTNRHYRLNYEYPFEVVQTEALDSGMYNPVGYLPEIFTTEDEATYHKYAHMINDKRLSEKHQRALKLKMKYILWEHPEYKL